MTFKQTIGSGDGTTVGGLVGFDPACPACGVSTDALIGALASLSCALTWAIASLVFAAALSETKATAAGLGVVKAVIATPLLLLVGLVSGRGLPDVGDQLGTLALTSVLGLLVADTAWLQSLARLGVARGVLLIPLVPVTTAVLARVFLDEHLTPVALLGGALTLAGVVLASRAKQSDVDSGGAFTVTGVVLGGAYVLSQAGSNVLLKSVLVATEALHVASLRLLLGIPMLVLLVVSHSLLQGRGVGGVVTGIGPLLVRERLPRVAVAAVIGTMGGIWLGSIGTQRLPVAVATTLAATTPVWALVLLRLRGDVVPARAVVGALVAIVGVGLLASGR
jgi:drug/metabolite transporter (DMT)-like permease